MPNGNPNFNLAELERFFAPIAEIIEQFAKRRQLFVNRYYHEAPSWDFVFKHPTGGTGQIWLTKTAANTLEISACVHVDDLKRFTRSIRRSEPFVAPMDDAALTAQLESTLDEVLAWPLDKQFVTHGGFEKQWSLEAKIMSEHGQRK
jgi:hypothetical protein